MIRARHHACVLSLFVGVAFGQLSAVAQSQAPIAPTLHYTVEVRGDDRTAFFHQLEITRPDRDEVALSVAAWAPGSYRLLNESKNIANVTAVDETGASRAVAHPNALTWVVAARGASKLTVNWQLNNPGRAANNRSYLMASGGLLDGPRNYLYWRDHKELPAHVHFNVPATWRVATGLTPTFDPLTFTARNTDWLLDCPVSMGLLHSWPFEVRGVPMRAVLENGGKEPGFDTAKFVASIKRIVETTADIMGGLPYEHYTFLFSGGGGGLEHLTSTTIGVSTSGLGRNPQSHQGVIAHEHFHAWNVKRLRPKALGPFEYDGPVRTKSLWISEGLTDYYTEVILARSGHIDETGFMRNFQNSISSFLANSAHRTMSAEESSWTVWDYPYMGGPISYYQQGQILGLLMDLEIRGQTNNAHSLDDGMRLLYARFSGDHGFQSEDVISTFMEATGVNLHAFFLKHVSAAQDIDWPHYFRSMGYNALVTVRPVPTPPPALVDAGDGKRAVGPIVPATFVRLGLKTGDIITAVNGEIATSPGNVTRLMRAVEVGAPLVLDVQRGATTVKLTGKAEGLCELGALAARAGAENNAGGLVVGAVPVGSAAAEAGLQAGDIITAIGGKAIAAGESGDQWLRDLPIGRAATLGVTRGGRKFEVSVMAAPMVRRTLKLEVDPNATPIQLAIRESIIGRRAVAETRPSTTTRKAG